MKISLYDCLNARYPKEGEYIYCLKGHKLGNGKIHIRQMGRKLVFKVCQECKDFNDMREVK